jgi:hypothetical protein
MQDKYERLYIVTKGESPAINFTMQHPAQRVALCSTAANKACKQKWLNVWALDRVQPSVLFISTGTACTVNAPLPAVNALHKHSKYL